MATVGAGVIILAVFWLISLLFIVIFCSSQGNLKYVTLVPIAISTLLTIILIFIPKGELDANFNYPPYKYSYTSLLWILILTSLILTLFICLILYLQYDVLERRYAKVSRSVRPKRTQVEN